MFFLMREALRLATVDFLLSEVALVTVDCASAIADAVTSTDVRVLIRWCELKPSLGRA